MNAVCFNPKKKYNYFLFVFKFFIVIDDFYGFNGV